MMENEKEKCNMPGEMRNASKILQKKRPLGRLKHTLKWVL
jgi:hypothetical protein